ncbi:MAG: hypothetical protein QOH96_1563 [Blastocatellia bacterium]|jgi:hypothetical protein|nr:hypothetical protein [Blastocatellia bacterium]
MAQLYMVIVSTNYDIRGRAEGCQPRSGALFIALLIQGYVRTKRQARLQLSSQPHRAEGNFFQGGIRAVKARAGASGFKS